MNKLEISPIAYIKTDFKEKFGIPRQSGRVKSALGQIIFYPEYRNKNALKGIDGFNYLWLIFDFSLNHKQKWSATVRPPRLGGNKRVGVFCSRSPFRPNNLGLSSVKIEKVVNTEQYGNVIIVSGVDLLDGTPIYDIKPYIPSSDCHLDAVGGFSERFTDYKLKVEMSKDLQNKLPKDKLNELIECLSEDPRPSYQNDGRTYGMKFDKYDIKFCVENNILTVTDVQEK